MAVAKRLKNHQFLPLGSVAYCAVINVRSQQISAPEVEDDPAIRRLIDALAAASALFVEFGPL